MKKEVPSQHSPLSLSSPSARQPGPPVEQSIQFMGQKHQRKQRCSLLWSITSSLWVSRTRRILRAVSPASSRLKLHTPTSSCRLFFPAEDGPKHLAERESELLSLQEERSDTSSDRYTSSRGRRRTAPGHALHRQSSVCPQQSSIQTFRLDTVSILQL